MVIYASLKAQQKEIEDQRAQFQKQVELSALASYSEITKALWESNMKNVEKMELPKEKEEARKQALYRYDEMMRARTACEKILMERELI